MKSAREILTENLYRATQDAAWTGNLADALVAALDHSGLVVVERKTLEQAADALMNSDPGNPKDATGWASDESCDAWVAMRDAIEKAKFERNVAVVREATEKAKGRE